MSQYKVGVLALQGGFAEHLQILKHFGTGIVGVDVRDQSTLATVDALIIPGGESSVMRTVAKECGLDEALKAFGKQKPIWGVCAGMILLANDIEGEDCIVGGLDMKVKRNFFGRQNKSSLRKMMLAGSAKTAGCCDVSHFIRAPAVETSKLASDIEVLACVNDNAVAVRKGHLLATAFHPEVTNDSTWHAYFLRDICKATPGISGTKFDANPLPAVGINMMFGGADAIEAAAAGPVLGSTSVKFAMPRFLQGGVIMDVVNVEQALIAEEAGACSIMALERIPADIKADGGIARMSDPKMIRDICNAVKIPVMAKARIGHFGEAAVLDSLEVDCIDESEVLTPADEVNHIRKSQFRVPFVCGAKNLGEALRRIAEGAAMIRLKGNAGTGNVLHAIRHARSVFGEIRQLQALDEDEVFVFAKEHQAPLELVQITRKLGRLPVTTFAAGGVATPADCSMLMALGCDGVFVGSGIFKGENPAQRARAMVLACTYWRDPKVVSEVSEGLGKAMVGILDNGETYNYVADSKL
jgi:pyridoxal 5'-phosphate synthase pdxS subunit